MADSLITNTADDRGIHADELRSVPAILMVGSAEAGAPAVTDALITFDRRLGVGRRAADLCDADSAWLVADHLVSRAHCRIERRGSGFVIADLGSRNGTYLDGRLLDATRSA